MKVLVPIKSVPDYLAKVKLKADGSAVDTDGVKWIVNPFDEIAVEEAIRLREKGKVTEVTVVTVGNDSTQTALRSMLAMGADKAVHIKVDGAVDSDFASRVLEKEFQRGGYHFVLMGKQAIDSDAGQTAQLLATRLKVPQACFASKIEIDSAHAIVTREVDGGLETIKVSLPAVISTDLRLNVPRYIPLPGIMKAKKMPIDSVSSEELGVSAAPKIQVKRYSLPSGRASGKKVGDVGELVKLLREEAKVL